ncbi:MAG TPA: hypothetical protein VHP33_36240 [Polyangiaceae bacterium]|nr:hypothetical protein [Polyangiaceae bacterium]
MHRPEDRSQRWQLPQPESAVQPSLPPLDPLPKPAVSQPGAELGHDVLKSTEPSEEYPSLTRYHAV